MADVKLITVGLANLEYGAAIAAIVADVNDNHRSMVQAVPVPIFDNGAMTGYYTPKVIVLDGTKAVTK